MCFWRMDRARVQPEGNTDPSACRRSHLSARPSTVGGGEAFDVLSRWGVLVPESLTAFSGCGYNKEPQEMVEGGFTAKIRMFSFVLSIHFNKICSNLKSEGRAR